MINEVKVHGATWKTNYSSSCTSLMIEVDKNTIMRETLVTPYCLTFVPFGQQSRCRTGHRKCV